MDIIHNIVIKTRKQFEMNTVDTAMLKKIYGSYTLIPNMDEFVTIALSQFPKLNCGLTSLYLQYLLQDGEVHSGKYKQENHTFLTIENLIIDITADQYGGPKIYIGSLCEPWLL